MMLEQFGERHAPALGSRRSSMVSRSPQAGHATAEAVK
jgi:hypothetical protein